MVGAKRLVLWALYDDAESSVNFAVRENFSDKFIVYSIGINDVTLPPSDNLFYEKNDLSLLNFNLINQLNKLPKPDVIMTSPPCECWSSADCSGKMFMSIDEKGNWFVKNRFFMMITKKCNPAKRRKFLQKKLVVYLEKQLLVQQ